MKQTIKISALLIIICGFFSVLYTQPIPPTSLNSSDVTTPVELVSVTANLAGDKVELNWETKTETNNYGFDIQRRYSTADDTTSWVKIGFVHGNGTTNTPHTHTFADTVLPKALSVSYRLKQIDTDGAFDYSKTVTVDISAITAIDNASDLPTEFNLSQNYPNPFNPATTIKYTIPANAAGQNVKLIVYNMIGQEVRTLVNETKAAGKYEVRFNAADLASGVYLYQLQAGEFTAVKKLMLLK